MTIWVYSRGFLYFSFAWFDSSIKRFTIQLRRKQESRTSLNNVVWGTYTYNDERSNVWETIFQGSVSKMHLRTFRTILRRRNWNKMLWSTFDRELFLHAVLVRSNKILDDRIRVSMIMFKTTENPAIYTYQQKSRETTRWIRVPDSCPLPCKLWNCTLEPFNPRQLDHRDTLNAFLEVVYQFSNYDRWIELFESYNVFAMLDCLSFVSQRHWGKQSSSAPGVDTFILKQYPSKGRRESGKWKR